MFWDYRTKHRQYENPIHGCTQKPDTTDIHHESLHTIIYIMHELSQCYSLVDLKGWLNYYLIVSICG